MEAPAQREDRVKATYLAVAVAACFPVAISQTARAQASAPVEKVEEIVVQGSFLDTGGTAGLKSDIPIRDTPFSVGNYTDAFMKAIETTTVADMYSYMTGIQRAGNTGYDLNIRGFTTGQTDKNAIV